MKKGDGFGIWGLVFRYLLIIAGIFALPLFYLVFRVPTIYLTYFLSNIFYHVHISGTALVFGSISVGIIDACVAGIAYFILLVLNLSTSGISFLKRVYLFLFSSLIFLMVNVIRIFLLIVLLINGSTWFDMAHLIFFYVMSIVFVFLIWILSLSVFRIREIPVYSDVKAIVSGLKSR